MATQTVEFMMADECIVASPRLSAWRSSIAPGEWLLVLGSDRRHFAQARPDLAAGVVTVERRRGEIINLPLSEVYPYCPPLVRKLTDEMKNPGFYLELYRERGFAEPEAPAMAHRAKIIAGAVRRIDSWLDQNRPHTASKRHTPSPPSVTPNLRLT